MTKTFMLKLACAAAAGVLVLAPGSARLTAQQAASAGGSAADVETFHVQDDVYVIAGAGANITVEFGPQGTLVVDTGNGTMSDKVIAAIRRLTPQPIRYVVNTSADTDHTGGNEKIVLAGEAIPGRNFVGEGAELISHENVLKRLNDAHLPISAIPTLSFFVAQKDLYFNGQAVQIFFEPNAHTDGDTMVYFRRADVLSVGELFSTETYPVIDAQRGGGVQGVLNALNHVLDIQVAGEKEEGGTYVIPARGRVVDEADVVEYRDMVTIIRDRVQDLVKKGQSLEQVKASNATFDFDGVYGNSKTWTRDMFLEAVYRDASKPAAAAPKNAPAEPKDRRPAAKSSR